MQRPNLGLARMRREDDMLGKLRGSRKDCVIGVLSCAVLMMVVTPTWAWPQSSIATPSANGDQLLFVFDARTNRVPFLGITSFAAEPIVLKIDFYAQGLDRILATQFRMLATSANLVIDPMTIAGVTGNAGIAVATPVRSENDPTPIVPLAPEGYNDGPLYGLATFANVELQAGFGVGALGRIAVNASGERAQAGATVDGATVQYQSFEPVTLLLPLYFNPQTLSPPEVDGNRIVLAAFRDDYAGAYSLAPVEVQVQYALRDATGTTFVERFGEDSLKFSGVLFTTLQTLAGDTALASSGKALFALGTSEGVNVVGLASQAANPFSIGQVLPGVGRPKD